MLEDFCGFNVLADEPVLDNSEITNEIPSLTRIFPVVPPEIANGAELFKRPTAARSSSLHIPETRVRGCAPWKVAMGAPESW